MGLGTVLANIWEAVVLLLWMMVLMPYSIVAPFLPKRRKDVSRDIVFITGSGSGIGRLTSLGLAKLGAHVICTDIDETTAATTASMIRANGGMGTSFQLDVTDREAVYKLAERIRGDIGDVTILINNAGIVTGKKFLDCPDSMMIKTMDVNTIAHFWTLKAFLPSMIKNNHGHVVGIASIVGFCGCPGVADYVASKFGAVGLMDALFLELLETADKVKTTVVAPFLINTGMFDGAVTFTPILLPVLEPQWVADKIVDGILTNEQFVILPKLLWWLVVFQPMLPSSVNVKLMQWLRVNEQMTGFKGRVKSE